MKNASKISDILVKSVFVPTYQRAYSWDTPTPGSQKKTQTDVFLADLEEHMSSKASSPYYLGHFIFESKDDKSYAVIDGQQRLTTIVIFLAALRKCIKNLNPNSKLLSNSIFNFSFSTVDYDDQFFKDYIINEIKKKKTVFDTVSSKRIFGCYQHLAQELAKKNEKQLESILFALSNASCTTHIVARESEAVQMFIFQNNRGKQPSNLEIIKAQFMYAVHLHAGTDKDDLIKEINNRFEIIYESISKIENFINEDDLLQYTLRVYFNSLWESDAVSRVTRELSNKNPLNFIKSFSLELQNSFENLTLFFGQDNTPKNMGIHSLISLSGLAIALPFVIKGYKFSLPLNDIEKLCSAFESIILRQRLIGTRAELQARLKDNFTNFTEENSSIDKILEKISYLKTASEENTWWAYWSNAALERSIQGKIPSNTARFLLWRYEIFLAQQDQRGYLPDAFDKIDHPELEHIAPQTEPDKSEGFSGYPQYDRDFHERYLDCLGNYLLASKAHNASLGNKPFSKKRTAYTALYQQREVDNMVPCSARAAWNKPRIEERKNKLIKFILDTF